MIFRTHTTRGDMVSCMVCLMHVTCEYMVCLTLTNVHVMFPPNVQTRLFVHHAVPATWHCSSEPREHLPILGAATRHSLVRGEANASTPQRCCRLPAHPNTNTFMCLHTQRPTHLCACIHRQIGIKSTGSAYACACVCM
jgi:hypothetical protein